MNSLPIFFLPGIGTDQSLVRRVSDPKPSVLEWPEPGDPRESLDRYTERLLRLLGEIHPLGAPLILAGHSFGGLMALHLASKLGASVQAVALVSSFRSPSALSSVLRGVSHMGLRHLGSGPSAVFQRGTVALLGSLPLPESRRVYLESLKRFSPRTLAWCTRMVFELTPPRPECPVFQLHGSADPLLPLSRSQADRVVRGGAHLLPLSHPREVGDFLRWVNGQVETSGMWLGHLGGIECKRIEY